jgi:putative transposase
VAQQGGIAERKAMIDRTHALPVSQQARLVGIARSSVYYRAQPVSEADQLLMRRIDELHMEFPFAGARMLARLLSAFVRRHRGAATSGTLTRSW